MTEKLPSDAVAVVPAAGKGERLGMGPKAFLRLGERTVLDRVVRIVRQCVPRVVVGVPRERLKETRSRLDGLADIYAGRSSRQQTILHLLKHTREPLVVIHDVTRPFASVALIRRVLNAAADYQAAATFVSSPIPAARHRADFVTEVIPRSQFVLPQSPMAFHRDVLEAAYRNAIEHGIEDQTTWELLLRINIPIRVVPGEERNIKITRPLDWEIAQKVIIPSQERILR
jgi:2-C-methyl-D-erythritol 4-phosphate cytidylyltransferase